MFDERFARQYRSKPPPEFPLALLFTGIVHHLSGPSNCAQTQSCIMYRLVAGAKIPAVTFITPRGIKTLDLHRY